METKVVKGQKSTNATGARQRETQKSSENPEHQRLGQGKVQSDVTGVTDPMLALVLCWGPDREEGNPLCHSHYYPLDSPVNCNKEVDAGCPFCCLGL